MKNDIFDRLEKRIQQAVGVIATLRESNAQLQKECDTLRASVEAAEAARDQAREDLETVREQSISKQEFETRKGEIESRVATLLERFDELDETAAESAEA